MHAFVIRLNVGSYFAFSFWILEDISLTYKASIDDVVLRRLNDASCFTSRYEHNDAHNEHGLFLEVR